LSRFAALYGYFRRDIPGSQRNAVEPKHWAPEKIRTPVRCFWKPVRLPRVSKFNVDWARVSSRLEAVKLFGNKLPQLAIDGLLERAWAWQPTPSILILPR